MRTTSLSTSAGDFVTGQYTGGTISVVDPGANCTNQRFHVLGTLGNVTTSTTAGGTGASTSCSPTTASSCSAPV